MLPVRRVFLHIRLRIYRRRRCRRCIRHSIRGFLLYITNRSICIHRLLRLRRFRHHLRSIRIHRRRRIFSMRRRHIRCSIPYRHMIHRIPRRRITRNRRYRLHTMRIRHISNTSITILIRRVCSCVYFVCVLRRIRSSSRRMSSV